MSPRKPIAGAQVVRSPHDGGYYVETWHADGTPGPTYPARGVYLDRDNAERIRGAKLRRAGVLP